MSYHDQKTLNYLMRFNNVTKKVGKYCMGCEVFISGDKCFKCGGEDSNKIIEKEQIISTMKGPIVEKPDFSKYPPVVLNPGETFPGQDPTKNRLSRKPS